VKIVLNHFGGPLGVGPYKRDEVFPGWRADIKALAACPNVYVKLGGLAMIVNAFDFHLAPLPPSSGEMASAWRPYVDACVENFGASRCMFESNFPVRLDLADRIRGIHAEEPAPQPRRKRRGDEEADRTASRKRRRGAADRRDGGVRL
jgi:predicted TIM-barrel fold metal-dependent hydrolase